MRITKNQVGITIIAVAILFWASVWVSWPISIAITLSFWGYCIMETDNDKKQAPEKNPEFIPSCDKENDVHTFSTPKKGSLCHCCVRKWGG